MLYGVAVWASMAFSMMPMPRVLAHPSSTLAVTPAPVVISTTGKIAAKETFFYVHGNGGAVSFAVATYKGAIDLPGMGLRQSRPVSYCV